MISRVPTEEMPSVRNSRDAFDTIRALDSAVSALDFLMKKPLKILSHLLGFD